MNPRWAAPLAVVATLALAAGMIAAPWWGHVDDTDAHLYRVVVRHMQADGTWMDLRYLPGAHAKFREHLPFGLWPYAAAARIAGEGALPVVAACFTLLTIAVVLSTGWRLAGPAAGVTAALVLATTESFAVYGGRERLDPILVLFATGSVSPILVGSLGPSRLATSALFGSLATLVKGPFGLLPVVGAAVARALDEDAAHHRFARGSGDGRRIAVPRVRGLEPHRLGSLVVGWIRARTTLGVGFRGADRWRAGAVVSGDDDRGPILARPSSRRGGVLARRPWNIHADA